MCGGSKGGAQPAQPMTTPSYGLANSHTAVTKSVTEDKTKQTDTTADAETPEAPSQTGTGPNFHM
jgi:hypothetical protein